MNLYSPVVFNRAQPLAWEQVERDIEAESFDQTSASLLFGPFDEVVQSAFFLPWVRILPYSVMLMAAL